MTLRVTRRGVARLDGDTTARLRGELLSLTVFACRGFLEPSLLSWVREWSAW